MGKVLALTIIRGVGPHRPSGGDSVERAVPEADEPTHPGVDGAPPSPGAGEPEAGESPGVEGILAAPSTALSPAFVLLHPVAARKDANPTVPSVRAMGRVMPIS
jgi:hypothetical protein